SLRHYFCSVVAMVLPLVCHNSFDSLAFFYQYSASPEICTLSLRDALPIFIDDTPTFALGDGTVAVTDGPTAEKLGVHTGGLLARSEEHTSELQSREKLVCRLLLEKKKRNNASGSSGRGSQG